MPPSLRICGHSVQNIFILLEELQKVIVVFESVVIVATGYVNVTPGTD
jgi:hypothetical protein